MCILYGFIAGLCAWLICEIVAYIAYRLVGSKFGDGR